MEQTQTPDLNPFTNKKIARDNVEAAFVQPEGGVVQPPAAIAGDAHLGRVDTEPASQSSVQADVLSARDRDNPSSILDGAVPQVSPTAIGLVPPEPANVPPPIVVDGGAIAVPGAQRSAAPAGIQPGAYDRQQYEARNPFEPPSATAPVVKSPGASYQGGEASGQSPNSQ